LAGKSPRPLNKSPAERQAQTNQVRVNKPGARAVSPVKRLVNPGNQARKETAQLRAALEPKAGVVNPEVAAQAKGDAAVVRVVRITPQ